MLPAYIGAIRASLKLTPGADALAELRMRLYPEDERERPPSRAPAVVRLKASVRELERGMAPAATLEEFAEDLRVLRLFAPDDEPMSEAALTRLLKDVAAVDAQDRAVKPRLRVLQNPGDRGGGRG